MQVSIFAALSISMLQGKASGVYVLGRHVVLTLTCILLISHAVVV